MNRLFLFIILFVAASCESNEFDFETSDTIVVEAYLHENQPVTLFEVSQLIPIIPEDGEDYRISDAEVYLHWNDESFQLTHTTVDEEEGFYYYEGTDLEITQGETYSISIDYFGKTTIAYTTVPVKPEGVSMNYETISIEPIDDFEDLADRNPDDFDPIEVYWNNPGGERYFYIVAENIESNPSDINELFDIGEFEIITPPTNLDVYNINPFQISQYGTHRIIIYSVNQEYVDLYESSEEDSRNLTEPLSNIENGLGIFTSFSSDTLYLEVTR
ncbi:MAG: DUF4249 domain-containing protein [Balneolales bacterium]|nr:DUF4249 domain-containing protein [Balneolales bacterium]